MKTYRIIKKTHLEKIKYIIEKRFLGCLWWYKFTNANFDKYDDAVQAICNDAEDPKFEVIAELTFNDEQPFNE